MPLAIPLRAIRIALVILISIFNLTLFAQPSFPQEITFPYMLRTTQPVLVDGSLDEWAFAFPAPHNSQSVPDSSRFRVDLSGNLPLDDDDLSGEIYLMYDDLALYFAAKVRDDFPGFTSDVQWASDAIELYISNFDIPGVWKPEQEVGAIDSSDGRYFLQFNISFNAALDSTAIFAYGPFQQRIETQNTFMTYQIWPEGNGYTLEGQIDWLDVVSPTTGNNLMPTPGERIAFTWSLYDIDPGDEIDGGANFDGWAYTELGYAAWMGPGPGYQFLEVMENSRGFTWEDQALFDFVTPFAKQVAFNRIPVIDGELNDWNFVFPADHWISVVPDSGRFPNEGLPEPTFDEDLKGTIYLQHDDENDLIYFATSARDNFPGWLSDVVSWQGDVTELYLGNFDIGDALLPPDRGQVNDPVSGDYFLELNIGFDAERDSTKILVYNEFNVNIITPGTYMAYQVWPNNDGYDLEGVIDIYDMASPTTGNIMEWEIGERIPLAWSLFDLDTTRVNESWKGLAYTPKGYAPWMGVSPGYQFVDIKWVSSIEMIDFSRVYPNITAIPPTENNILADDFHLKQNYPNPFNPSTTIVLQLERDRQVSLTIYNSLGQKVRSILRAEQLDRGEHHYLIDLGDLASGVYLTVLSSGNQQQSQKMLLLK